MKHCTVFSRTLYGVSVLIRQRPAQSRSGQERAGVCGAGQARRGEGGGVPIHVYGARPSAVRAT